MPESPVPLLATVILLHCVCWFRILRVPIAMFRRNLIASHIVLFLGRLSFIFGTSFFALLAYRHLPLLVEVPDHFRFAMRLVTTLMILFSLYCYSTELERLGVAIRPPPKH